MGTSEFSIPILKSVYDSKHSILGVYTQPPKKKNRGQKIQNSTIHDFANKLNIPVYYPDSLDKNEINRIQRLKPDIVLVVAYGKLLPTELLNLEDVLFLNIHTSLLPRWRGAAPVQRAIMSMDKETGISIMKIIPKLDAGPILIQSKIKITSEMNSKDLSDKMSEEGAKLILDAFRLIENKR